MICAACRVNRDPGDLLVFWPHGRDEERRFVCRPTRPAHTFDGPCFARVVGPVNVHSIALLEAPARLDRRPVLPRTEAWDRLMREAGVRAVAA